MPSERLGNGVNSEGEKRFPEKYRMGRNCTFSQWLIATNTNQFCHIGDINTYFTESVQHQEAPEYIKGHRSPFDPLIRDKTFQPLGQGGALSGGFLRFSRIGQGPSFEDFWRFLGLFSNRPLARWLAGHYLAAPSHPNPRSV